MTYSIVGRDANSGQLGVALQSHYFAVGDGAPYVRLGTGAVCTQAFIERSYGPRGLDALDAGASAVDVVGQLIAADSGRARRQVGIVDARGRAAAYTGPRCLGYAGHQVGEGVTAQANMVASPSIWPAMIDAYESAPGQLADRLLAALNAAEAEGGDSRGRQSTVLIVAGENGEQMNLRVDDHVDPLAELARLLSLRRAYDRLARVQDSQGVLFGEASPAAVEHALAELAAAERTLGDNPEATFWRGVVLARAGRLDEARDHFNTAARSTRGWLDLLERLPAAGLLPTDPGFSARLMP